MMQSITGGASARPFITHHNALDIDLYLRVAPELYLKRLVVGGFERVFELGRVFRNEGVSTKHNPEFTILEVYQAFADFSDMMDLTESLVVHLLDEVVGTRELIYEGHTISLERPWRRVPMTDLVTEAVGRPLGVETPRAELEAAATGIGVVLTEHLAPGAIIGAIYEAIVERTLIQPTFVTDYPVDISPLARDHRSRPHYTERFELIVAGREAANAFSELNDPEIQAERFRQQASLRDAGDDEAMMYDEDYIRALEYGLPPTGGLGIGIDRLVMLLTGTSTIRDVLLFPTLRPEKFS